MSDTDSFQNPMLLNPNIPIGQGSVPPLASHTPPFPVEKVAEIKHYACAVLNHSMHRKDGKKLAFIFGHYATDDLYDIEYLENEIKHGNPFVKHATYQQIQTYNFRIDPKKTMAEEVRPEVEADLRNQLDIELRSTLQERMKTIGIAVTSEQVEALAAAFVRKSNDPDNSASVLAGTDAQLLSDLKNKAGVQSGTGIVYPGRLSGISGTDKMANAAESLSK